MKTALIVAMDRNRGIGRNNDLMWHLPADMKFFKEKTLGNVVVMGRKNWDSIPEKYRPLSNRENVVLTRNKDFKSEGCIVFHSLEECLAHYSDEKERIVFIIGGGEIYCHALDLNCVDEMYITHIDKVYDADRFFPEFDETEWKAEEIMTWEKDEKNEASFVTRKYSRKLDHNSKLV